MLTFSLKQVEHNGFRVPLSSEVLDQQFQLKSFSLTTCKGIKSTLAILGQDLLVFLTSLVLNFPHSYYVIGPQNHCQFGLLMGTVHGTQYIATAMIHSGKRRQIKSTACVKCCLPGKYIRISAQGFYWRPVTEAASTSTEQNSSLQKNSWCSLYAT